MKRNITIAVDEVTYRDARAWADEHYTSISAIVEYCIRRLPRLEITREAGEKEIRRRERSLSRGLAAFEEAIQHYIEQDRKERQEEEA